MSKKHYSPAENSANQQNSNGTTLDHNNDAYKKAKDNHSRQLNPKDSKYAGEKSKGEKNK